jgi:hypothetical protein
VLADTPSQVATAALGRMGSRAGDEASALLLFMTVSY